ncbi:MAG: hypothetical protein HY741_04805 [Chloroflexi bacterium]|nr:hypothetical protein [Chloroflexota bacterium]
MSTQPGEVTPAVPTPAPAAPDKTQLVKTRGRLLVYGGVAVLLGIFAGTIAFALSYPIVKTIPQPLARGVDLAAVLAPIAVAALGIERMIEMMWNLIESYIRSFVAFLAGRSEWLRWANDELKAARERLAALAQEGDPTLRVADMLPTSQDALYQLIERAANDVALAEARLATLTSTTQYRDAKRVISIVTSLILGLIVATVVGLQMFALLGINVNERVDILITGIAIGTGSTPVHSLIGILQQGKDTLDGIQGFLKTRTAVVQREMSNQG